MMRQEAEEMIAQQSAKAATAERELKSAKACYQEQWLTLTQTLSMEQAGRAHDRELALEAIGKLNADSHA